MTLKELFYFLNQNTPHEFISEKSPLNKAMQGEHENTLIGEMIKHVTDKCHCESEETLLERNQVIAALGPLRLKYMKDDAPVEGFRLIEGTIPVIDLAFNEEAQRNKT